MSEQEREELKRTKVQHLKKKLKTGEEDIKKKAPVKLRRRRRSRKRQRVVLFVMLGILALAVLTTYVVLKDHYETYPGAMERETLRLMGRGSDYLAFRWEAARNIDEYKVYFKEYVRKDTRENPGSEEYDLTVDESWEERSTKGTEIMFDDLKEGTTYAIALRADSPSMEGSITRAKTFSTKKTQNLNITKKITKLTSSKPFKIAGNAQTQLKCESSNPEVAEVNEKTGEIVIKGPGVTDIMIEAEESAFYKADSGVTELTVLDSSPVRAGGARAYTIHHLSADNCEVVKEISGADGADIPQSFGYTGDKYIVAFGMGSPDRIISFDVEGDGKEVSVPQISLGHPNGFAYADENKTCYCVKGWSSRAVTYKPETGEYGTMNFSYGCSGIGYDRKEKKLYTSSRTVMASYNIADYSVANTTGVVSHSGSMATQDVGGHGGIMLRCLSPNGNKHGINYIDLYDMREGMYLGSFSCDLSEVEDAIVNKEGFLEILANNSGNPDYIWRTDINIETLAEGINYEN